MAYTKTIWENSPSENTPISAENLNNIENGISGVDTRLTTAETDINTLETNQGTLASLTTTAKTNLVGAINEVDSHTDTNTSDITNLKTGWNILSATLTYSSWTAETYTGVINTSIDLTPIISVGMKMRISQTTIKYFIVTKITSTQITGYFGTDYTLANATISTPKYSVVKTPFGFPMNPDKWSVTVTDTTNRNQANPVANTWYNLGSVKIDIPIGIWKTSYKIYGYIERATGTGTAMFVTLSTANNTQSDSKNTVGAYNSASTGMAQALTLRDITIDLATATSYYANTMTDSTGITSLNNSNGQSALILKAVCAYL